MKKSSISSSLNGKKPLKSYAKLKQNVKPKKQKVPTLTTMRRKADALFGHYVRLRDAELIGNIEWQGSCISCGRTYVVRWYDEDQQKWRWGKQDNIGHFVSRGNLFLRYDEYNCNLQCVRCNKYLNGNIAAYSINLDLKYGDNTAQELVNLADTNKDYKLTLEALQNVINASNEYLEWAYQQEKLLNA